MLATVISAPSARRPTAFLAAILLGVVALLAPAAALADGDPDNGDWAEQYVTLRDTGEAELMVRVGSIDKVGFGFREGENPFEAAEQWSHPFPWTAPEDAADGTDRIMLGTAYQGEALDGYARQWAENPAEATTRPIELRYDASGITVRNALLQIVIDDFQALHWGSRFTATLNGRSAPFISEVINHVDQTGPVVQVISVEVPSSFLPEVASGSLSLFIDEATGLGDGFAIDFVKLLVNYARTAYVSRVEGLVTDEANEPLEGATVRVLGTRNVLVTDTEGRYRAEVASGLNAFRASHDGYVEAYTFTVTPAGETVEPPPLRLEPGQGEPDTNYSTFAAGGAWERASSWASPELARADALGLIPDAIRGRDMTRSITRAEFAAVVVRVYESLSGTTAVPASANPFTDTADPDVLKAFEEDLAVGVAPDRFDPDALLNREQAATMLTRVVKKISFPDWTYATDDQYELSFPEQPPFEDDASISPWAKDSVYYMVANGIITGADDDAFSPRGVTTEEEAGGLASTTREQALVLALRMVENLR
jgi:hypothetical protein